MGVVGVVFIIFGILSLVVVLTKVFPKDTRISAKSFVPAFTLLVACAVALVGSLLVSRWFHESDKGGSQQGIEGGLDSSGKGGAE